MNSSCNNNRILIVLQLLRSLAQSTIFSKGADMHKVAPKKNKENFVDILEVNNVVIVDEKIDPGAPSSPVVVTEGNYKQGFGQVNSKSPVLSDVNSVRDQAKTAVAVNDACSPAVSLGQNDFVLSGVDNQGGQAKTAVAVNDACPPVVSFGENPNSFDMCDAASSVTPNTIDSVPFVTNSSSISVDINGYSFPSLIDTGAAITAVSADVWNTYLCHEYPSLSKANSENVTAVNGCSLKTH